MAAVTSYQDTTMSVSAIGGRTDAEGDDVTDYTAEEARFLAEIFTEGYVKPADAFKVQPADTPDMSVVVGSGTAKADFYVVAGDASGQGKYIVRLDSAGQSVTVPAADASQARTDEVYLVVADNTYDAGGLSLPRIGYRRGDAGGSAPGPDTSWEAYVLLATISVPALESAIEAANITDEREAASLEVGANTGDLIDAKGDLLVGTAADTIGRLAVGTNGQALVADSSQTAGLKWGAAGFSDVDYQVFESSGTWTKPAGAVKVWVQVVGGGGAGKSVSTSTTPGGGGAGGYAAKMFDAADLGSSETVTVGAGGAGSADNSGGNGSSSSFAGVTGGGGGGASAGTSGGDGGTASGGDLNCGGSVGYPGSATHGGASFFGGAGAGGDDATGYGSGGGGSINSFAGGDGADGVVIVTTYISA